MGRISEKSCKIPAKKTGGTVLYATARMSYKLMKKSNYAAGEERSGGATS